MSHQGSAKDLKRQFLSAIALMMVRRSIVDRANRSNRVTTRVLPGCKPFRRLCSWGRSLWAAVVAGRDVLKDTPGIANQMLSVGRTLYAWALPLGLCNANPFIHVKPLPMADKGHIPWPKFVVDYVLEKASPDLVRLTRLGIMTCQRESDLVRMGPEHRQKNGIWCRPKKTKRNRRSFCIPLSTTDALELERWSETPIMFKASRWKSPIARFRSDLYLYSPKEAPYSPSSLRARWMRWLKRTPDGAELCRLWKEFGLLTR